MELLDFGWIYFPTKVILPAADVLGKLGAHCTWASHGKWFWLGLSAIYSCECSKGGSCPDTPRNTSHWHVPDLGIPIPGLIIFNKHWVRWHWEQPSNVITFPESPKKCWEDMESLRISYPTRGWYEVPEAHREYLCIYFIIQPISMIFTTRNRIISVSNPRDETALETHKATQKTHP